jgi:uncharacterized membrane protein YciS (DUF1049 family)
LTIPIWAVGAVAAVFLVLSMLAIAQAGTATVMHVMFRAGIVIGVFCAGLIYLQQTERQEYAAERRALEERSLALLARAVAPGSALSCLNELAGEAVETACEKAVFASPEAVSAAVNYITAELTLLLEADAYARRASPAFAAKFAPLRTALELDRFGIVAHVLEVRGCTAEKCEAADGFNDASRVLTNLREHVFEDRVTQFTVVWNAPRPAADATAVAPAAPLPLRPSAIVSPKYDFPSSDSIPPVNIMVPEGGSRSAAGAQPDVGAKSAPTPVPVRRPQTRPTAAAASRAAAPRPAAPQVPVAVGQGSSDGGGTPTTGAGQPQ